MLPEDLKALGLKVVMLTGDSTRVARRVARELGVDEVKSQVLTEDKAGYIEKEHAQGRSCIMIGDGVNDSPALSNADVGIAINSGAVEILQPTYTALLHNGSTVAISMKSMTNLLEKN